uniref:Uncharacterized protein n=1 Tax=Magallana gigas TaxID=29159 RepID=K1PLE7_MAGGI
MHAACILTSMETDVYRESKTVMVKIQVIMVAANEEGKSSTLSLVLGEGTMLSILDGDGAEIIGVSGVTQG